MGGEAPTEPTVPPKSRQEPRSPVSSHNKQKWCASILESQTYGQISRQLETSVSHVAVLLNRAKSKLRQVLVDRVPSPSTNAVRQSNNG